MAARSTNTTPPNGVQVVNGVLYVQGSGRGTVAVYAEGAWSDAETEERAESQQSTEFGAAPRKP